MNMNPQQQAEQALALMRRQGFDAAMAEASEHQLAELNVAHNEPALMRSTQRHKLSLLGLLDATRVQVRVLSENASAALMFSDAKAAGELLQSLRNAPDIRVAALYDKAGGLYAADDGVREDSTPENLAKLKPFFDRKYGNVTAGNSSQVTDGAAWLVLASEQAVRRFGLVSRGRIVDSQWAGLDPAQMGLGPVHAATPILKRHGLGLGDLDAWEINEAFAAQVLACERAWESADYCRDELGADGALGKLDPAKLNVDGGAIALGHPVGASGARIVLHLLNVLERTGGRRGMAAICIGGGLGGAMLVERA